MSDESERAAHFAALHTAIEQRVNAHCSPAVAAKARLMLMDTLGCALAGRTVAPVLALETQSSAREPGGFRLPGGPLLTTGAGTQVLAMAATWHEACEGLALAHGRPGVPVIAAAAFTPWRPSATVCTAS